jgi:MYXO-CTERM domain-containing protein
LVLGHAERLGAQSGGGDGPNAQSGLLALLGLALLLVYGVIGWLAG